MLRAIDGKVKSPLYSCLLEQHLGWRMEHSLDQIYFRYESMEDFVQHTRTALVLCA